MKRTIDIFLSLLFLIFSTPILLLVSFYVFIFINKKFIFTQTRPGLNGKPFKIYKFTSMSSERNSQGDLLSDNLRLNKFGNLLRKSSLDELPELWNILKGDMSLVGPRPLLMEYLDLYTPRQFLRHSVRPGLTGWAQINGRNLISWEEKFEFDIWYIENQSIYLDMKILALTIKKVIFREGINANNEATIAKFKKND